MARKASSHETHAARTRGTPTPASEPRVERDFASEVPVFCKFDRIIPAAELKLWPKNYRRHPDEQLEAMRVAISGNGWRRAPVMSRRSGFIVKGNGAVQMAQAHGLDVPVEIQDYASEAEEVRDAIADNELGQRAETNLDALQTLLGLLSTEDLKFTGLDQADLDLEKELMEIRLPLSPPKMAWVLIGIPVVRFGDINAEIEQIARVQGVVIENTLSDEDGQP